MELKEILQQHTDAVEVQIAALGSDVKGALEEVGFVKSVMGDLEQKFSRMPADLASAGSLQTAGQRFVEADEVKSFIGNASSGRRLSVEVKAITTATRQACREGQCSSLIEGNPR